MAVRSKLYKIVVLGSVSAVVIFLLQESTFLSQFVEENISVLSKAQHRSLSPFDFASNTNTAAQTETTTLQPTVHFKPLLTQNVIDPWKKELFTRLDHIREGCGDLCSINDKKSFEEHISKKGKEFSTLQANVNCRSLFELQEIDAADDTFPKHPPEELMDYYTLHGLIRYKFVRRFQQEYLETKELVWSEKQVNDLIEMAENKTLKGTYHSIPICENLKHEIKNDIHATNKHILVIGSETPWVEAICLWAGAAHVTTLEYASIRSEHPKLDAMTPASFRAAYLNGTLPVFDAVVTFSSMEHSGLGRYGDALNPWGDILGVARAWCATKSNGRMLLGLPFDKSRTSDGIIWNAHRQYGKYRWSLVTTNWVPLEGVDNFNWEKWGIPPAAVTRIFIKATPNDTL